MMLRRITLKTFAGSTNRGIDIEPGLNIISGPNEAGKSTIFHAINAVLTIPSDLTARETQKHLGAFMPATGGDSIAVAAGFDHAGASYSIERSWGAERGTRLTLPDGAIIADDDEVAGRLEAMLPAPTGTLRTIFFSYQSALPAILEQLSTDPGVFSSLSDILRRGVCSRVYRTYSGVVF